MPNFNFHHLLEAYQCFFSVSAKKHRIQVFALQYFVYPVYSLKGFCDLEVVVDEQYLTN